MHELNNRGAEALGERQSRHIYDIVQIHAAFPHFVTDRALLDAVVDHKRKYFHRGSAKWDQAKSGTLNIVPFGDVAKRLKEDWDKMADMFPSELPYTFAELLEQLNLIDKELNG